MPLPSQTPWPGQKGHGEHTSASPGLGSFPKYPSAQYEQSVLPFRLLAARHPLLVTQNARQALVPRRTGTVCCRPSSRGRRSGCCTRTSSRYAGCQCTCRCRGHCTHYHPSCQGNLRSHCVSRLCEACFAHGWSHPKVSCCTASSHLRANRVSMSTFRCLHESPIGTYHSKSPVQYVAVATTRTLHPLRTDPSHVPWLLMTANPSKLRHQRSHTVRRVTNKRVQRLTPTTYASVPAWLLKSARAASAIRAIIPAPRQ